MTAPRPILLVEGGRDDLDAVGLVMSDSFDPAYGEAWTTAQCAAMLPMAGVWLSLAKEGDDIVGFALGRSVLKESELLLLAVKKERQRMGIGQQLVDRFVRLSRDRGAEILHLEVRDGNPAVKLYNALGFSEVGRRRNYYTGKDGQVYDAITLAKAIGR